MLTRFLRILLVVLCALCVLGLVYGSSLFGH